MISPDQINVYDDKCPLKTFDEVLTEEKLIITETVNNNALVLELINEIKNCLEKRFGETLDISLRNDLLRKISLVPSHIGGNSTPAFSQIINLTYENYVVQIITNWQKAELPKVKLSLWQKVKEYFNHV